MPDPSPSVELLNPDAASSVVLVCEHASHAIPAEYGALGLTQDVLHSHIAWDPGALGVAKAMAAQLQAKLVAGCVSRLIYDCNRPPEAPDAVPKVSEIYKIPGNQGLDAEATGQRVTQVYRPFQAKLRDVLAETDHPVLVTIHSFTPVYHGTPRTLEVGILHDADSRLADALFAILGPQEHLARNQPYGPEDGVTHTLKEHGLAEGRLNVMIEIRNDLIRTDAQQAAFGARLAGWVTRALEHLATPEGTSCNA